MSRPAMEDDYDHDITSSLDVVDHQNDTASVSPVEPSLHASSHVNHSKQPSSSTSSILEQDEIIEEPPYDLDEGDISGDISRPIKHVATVSPPQSIHETDAVGKEEEDIVQNNLQNISLAEDDARRFDHDEDDDDHDNDEHEDVSFDSVHLEHDDRSSRLEREREREELELESERSNTPTSTLEQTPESPNSFTLSLNATEVNTPATTIAATSVFEFDPSAEESPSHPKFCHKKSNPSLTGIPIAIPDGQTEVEKEVSTMDITVEGETVKATLTNSPSVLSATTSTSPTTSPTASPVKSRKGSLNVPNVMQKVMSMTRQRDLPPKSKEEETKHLKQLEQMRAAAKEAEKRRHSQLNAAAAARASRIASVHSTWENSILPNWRAVTHDNAASRDLKALWWEGTMPTRYRGRLWNLCIGNGLAISKTAFANHLGEAKAGLEDGTFPYKTLTALEEDVEETLPRTKLFQKTGVMHDDLVDLLLAYVIYAAKQTGNKPRYPPGLASPAAMLLVNMPVVDAFIALCNLVDKSFLKSFYGNNPEEPDAYYRIFDTLLADYMPKVYENFSKEVIRPSLYLKPWLTTMFVRFLHFDLATRLFDVFLLEGDSFVFRVALILLQILEPRLFNPVQSELEDVFKGKDRGAVAVVKRERSGSISLGGRGEDPEGGEPVLVEEVYAQMGCTEDRVFELLHQQEWRQETWERLVERELPEAD